jgi:FRG domain
MCADQIKTVPIDSWNHFIDHLRSSSYDVGDYFYRGQGDPTWGLVPTLQRKLSYPIATRDIYTNEMYAYLRAFRDHAHGLIGFPDGLPTLDPLLTLGRHHGLVTPLLDWTRSPHIAAFFALSEDVARNANMPLDADPDPTRGRGGPATVAIWRYQIRGDGSVGNELTIYTEVRFPNVRQKAQSAAYMHLDTHEYRSVEDLLIDRGRAMNLEKWVVSVPDVREAIADLALMNIHIGTMFPDLLHAAQHANNKMNYPETFF